MADEKVDYEAAKLDLDRERLRLDEARIKLDVYRAELEKWRTKGESTNAFAMTALRSLLILNGGAAIAILSFVGNNLKPNVPADVKDWIPAFEVFGFGTFLAVLCAFLAYLSQVFINELNDENWNWWLGGGTRLTAILVGLASLLAFLCGMFRSIAALP